MLRSIKPALVIFGLLSLLTGMVYPLVVTGIAQLAFPSKADGSIIYRDGKPVGSELIGQPFTDPKYFWGRPSATSPVPYNASASSGSNLGPTNPALADAVRARAEALLAADPGNTEPIPADLITASASGLDPHISPEAAMYQARRVARSRGLSEESVKELVARHTEGRTFGIIGEARVNVLEMNIEIDTLRPGTSGAPSGSKGDGVASGWIGQGEGISTTLAKDLKPMLDNREPGIERENLRPGQCDKNSPLCPVPTKGKAVRTPDQSWKGLGEGVSKELAHDLAETGEFKSDQKSGPKR